MQEQIIVEKVTKSFKLKQGRGVFGIIKDAKNQFQNNRLRALDEVSFTVSKGEMVGIIGRNASGKTTLLRTIAGIYKPDSGKIQVNGRLAPLLHIGTGFHEELNASENIIISGMLMGMSKSEIKNKVDEIIDFSELGKFSNMKLKHYSSGMRARLAFSVGLKVNSDILLVDEILAVGDTAFKEKSFNAFLDFKKNGKTILYATHNLSNLKDLCDRVLLIHYGKLILIGNPSDVLAKYREINKKEKTN